jgi:Predicted signal-transduction protein containing cAMP-binding and CBS domains
MNTTLKLSELTLRQVPVIEPQTALDEAIRLMEGEPLKTVVLVGDEQYMGIFDEAASRSDLIPRKVDKATLEVGPYAESLNTVGHPQMTTREALVLMDRRHLDVLPVVDNNTYLGVVTRADLQG